MIYLREADVEALISMPVVIDAVREAFQQLAQGGAGNVPRVRAKGKGIVLHSMSATADYPGLVGWKQYTTTRSQAQFLVGVYDQSSGDLLALLEADRLGQMRTGAATGVAVSVLAPDARRVGLFGSGWQAESQLEAVAAVCQLDSIVVYSRRRERLEEFCQRMSERLELPVSGAADAAAAVRDRDVVITATTSREPLFAAEDLIENALVCAVGSNWPEKSEVPVDLVARATCVACDSIEACRSEAGDLLAAEGSGAFAWSNAVELADLVATPAKAQAVRESSGWRLFKSVGLAIEDIATAAAVLRAFHDRA